MISLFQLLSVRWLDLRHRRSPAPLVPCCSNHRSWGCREKFAGLCFYGRALRRTSRHGTLPGCLSSFTRVVVPFSNFSRSTLGLLRTYNVRAYSIYLSCSWRVGCWRTLALCYPPLFWGFWEFGPPFRSGLWKRKRVAGGEEHVAVTFRDQPQMKADYSRFSGDYYSHLEGSEPSRKEPLGCYSSWGNSGAPVVTTDHLYFSFHS